MRKLFVFLAAFALSFSAAAAGWDCMPSDIGGSGSKMITFADGNGKVRGWYCTPAPGLYKAQLLITLDNYQPGASCATSVADLLNTATGGNSTVAGANALLAKCGSVPASGTNKTNWDSLQKKGRELVLADMLANVVPPVVPPPATVYTYFVTANPQSTATPPTRPVYVLKDGVRGTTSVGSVPTGTACDPTKASVGTTASSTYMAFGPLFAVDRVTLCSKPKS